LRPLFAHLAPLLLPSAVHLFRTLTLSPTSRFCSCPPGTMGGSRKMKYTVAKTRGRRSSGGTTEKSVPRDLRAAGQQGSTLESRCMGGRRRDSRRLRTSSARPVRDQHWSSRFRPGLSYGVYAMAELAESVRPKRANHAVPESNLAGQKLPHLEGPPSQPSIGVPSSPWCARSDAPGRGRDSLARGGGKRLPESRWRRLRGAAGPWLRT
jgi:hypothetical protein